MTINFKTNVRTVIRYKGQEYSSADQLPAEARSAYEAALTKGVVPAATPGVKQQILLNGQHFASPDEMSAAERKLYDDAIAFVRASTTVSAAGNPPSGWLTATQLRLVLFFAAIAVVVVLVRLLH
ncbi:MAG: hypothetical protein DME97_03125 [Verrucomicrobia bacterium]|nr:MAG: hypothetical protein DME97_03125 [Verrucomicrobiota bacterium]